MDAFNFIIYMVWYKVFAQISLLVCLIISAYHLVRLIRLGKPIDYSKKAGNPLEGIRYSFTAAMSPQKKESAYLHLPTYTAGIIYHLGTFLSIFVFILIILSAPINSVLTYVIFLFTVGSGISGVGILLKRLIVLKLRRLSNPDDYISNLLVTAFHFITGIYVAFGFGETGYYLSAAILLLYFPIGKLKHAIYFFAARYHLGFFYGWRGVWPIK